MSDQPQHDGTTPGVDTIAAELRASEEFSRSILESSADCIKVIDLEGKLLSMNGPGLGVMEIDDFGMCENQPWTSFWPNAELVENALEIARSGRIARFSSFCPTAKGTPRWWDVIVSPVRDHSGAVARIVSTSRDITESKLAEERLRRELESSERLRELGTRLIGDYEDAEIYQELLDAAIALTNADAGSIQLFDIASGEPVVMLASGTAPKIDTREAAKTGGRVFFKRDDLDGGVRSASSTPLIARSGRRLGMISTYWDRDYELNESEERFLDQLARQAADLLERREAHRDLERRVALRTAELAEANAALVQEMEQRAVLERSRVELLGRVVTAQEQERRRIARDLHDQMGQALTGMRLKIAELKRSELVGPEDLEVLDEMAEGIDRDASFLALELRPLGLVEQGLDGALHAYVGQWSRRYGIAAEFHSTGVEKIQRPGNEAETHLYRIVQEALNNIAKHANATEAAVLLRAMPDTLVLSIEDNGRGFDTKQPSRNASSLHGHGVDGMRERATLIGGSFTIDSAGGVGTTVCVRIPISSTLGAAGVRDLEAA